MPIYNCPEFETRILEYDELNYTERVSLETHMATCDACRCFHAALEAVDFTLSRSIQALAVAPPAPPSLWPLVLDFAGWTSVMAALLVLCIAVAPAEMQEAAGWFALGGIVFLGSVYFGLTSWREAA